MINVTPPHHVQKVCDLVDALGPVSHELQNLFNGMVLQVALVKRRAPEELHEKIDVLKSLALQASEKLGQIDAFRHQLEIPVSVVDLHHVLGETLEAFSDPMVELRQELDTELLHVRADSWELSRLVDLIIRCSRDALHTTGRKGIIGIKTLGVEGNVQMIIEDDGPGMDEDRESDFFDPFRPIRPGEQPLDRAASYGLAKRLGIGMTVRSRAENGVFVTLEMAGSESVASP